MRLNRRYDTEYVYCHNDGCAYDGVAAGELVDDETQPGPGLPRPRVAGHSVPWIVPVIGGEVAWTALNKARVEKALACWLCQYCGTPLNSAGGAWVAVAQWLNADLDSVADGGALHEGCLDLARGECPALRQHQAFAFAEVRREDQTNEWEAVRRRVLDHERTRNRFPQRVPLQL
ncbi:hypothetical protein AB0A63_31205 [Lentzea sp. NPDC042327]|uniref:hypothetical protein n=1 Tax=Lentzea sp. NPDC042327 TaxID=3154801 RepID=UPI003401751E